MVIKWYDLCPRDLLIIGLNLHQIILKFLSPIMASLSSIWKERQPWTSKWKKLLYDIILPVWWDEFDSLVARSCCPPINLAEHLTVLGAPRLSFLWAFYHTVAYSFLIYFVRLASFLHQCIINHHYHRHHHHHRHHRSFSSSPVLVPALPSLLAPPSTNLCLCFRAFMFYLIFSCNLINWT